MLARGKATFAARTPALPRRKSTSLWIAETENLPGEAGPDMPVAKAGPELPTVFKMRRLAIRSTFPAPLTCPALL